MGISGPSKADPNNRALDYRDSDQLGADAALRGHRGRGASRPDREPSQCGHHRGVATFNQGGLHRHRHSPNWRLGLLVSRPVQRVHGLYP
jgi:hypothetical protein